MKMQNLVDSSLAKPLRLLLALGVSSIALGVATPALAQDAGAAAATAAALPEAEKPAEAEAIVVTGSRIRRTEFNSASPISIIDPLIGEKQGQIDTADLIQSSPIASGSSQITSAISSNFVTNGGQGTSTISLRGLGAERTLVLLNGRRAGPAGTRGAVQAFDLNVLPQSIVKSIEILKDGASSVYGSDAVAGVVNVITKRNTNGIEFDGFTSVPLSSGGEQYRMSATYGKDFGSGHFMASLDYYQRQELSRGQRKYLDCPEEYIFKQDGSRADLVDPRTGSARCNDTLWGHVWLYDYSYIYSGNPSNGVAANGRPIPRLQYSYAGDNLGRYVPGLTPAPDPFQLTAPAGFFPVGYDGPSTAVENAYHPFISGSTVIPKTKRITAYAEGSINITDDIELYGEALYNHRTSYQNGFRQFWQFGFTSNSTLPGIFSGSASAGDPFSPGFTGDYLISPTAITDHSDTNQVVDYFRGVGGLRGSFGSFAPSWTWDIYGQFSSSIGKYTTDQIYQDSIDTQDFRTGSCVGTLTAVRQVACRDVVFVDPQFLAGNISAADRAFLFGVETGRTKYTQAYGEASATGTLFKLPAGDVGLAVGAVYRKDKINDVPGDITYALKPGGNAANPADHINNAWGNTGAGVTAGFSETKEAFAEIQLPLIHDAPLIKSLTLSGAARVTSVKSVRSSDRISDSDNGNWTYKLGANWKVNDWVRLRGSYGTSFRAPALFEQFLANQTSFIAQRNIDPCIRYSTNPNISARVRTNCAASGLPANYAGGSITATVVTGGGLGLLDPETSVAKTASIIFTPKFAFLPETKISLAVDYFDIKVKGEISQLGSANVVGGCYSSDFFPTDPLCSLFTRVPAGQVNQYTISQVRDSFINVNSQRNRGIDVTANLRHDLGNLGSLALTAQMTWQFKDTVALFAGTEVSNNHEDGEPIWTGDFNLVWDLGSTSLFYGLDVTGGTSDIGDYTDANGSPCPISPASPIYGTYCVDLRASPTFYHSISISQEIGKKFEITAGVSNLFNTRPPRVSILNRGEIQTIGQSVFASQYDLVGRRVFIQAKAKF
jgi:iron complex outermembrane recepter protein